MTLKDKSVLIMLGGTWHRFDDFAAAMGDLFQAKDCRVDSTYDLDLLARLSNDYQLLLMYTCLTRNDSDSNETNVEKLTDKQVQGLRRWVRQGGGLLAAHAATEIGSSSPALGRLYGGIFRSHPPQLTFTVLPLSADHPITSGIPAFQVHDELYFQQVDPAVSVHMVAVYQDAAHPLVWSRSEGRGRVAHIAMGHSAEVWSHPCYQQLMVQAATWLTGA